MTALPPPGAAAGPGRAPEGGAPPCRGQTLANRQANPRFPTAQAAPRALSSPPQAPQAPPTVPRRGQARAAWPRARAPPTRLSGAFFLLLLLSCASRAVSPGTTAARAPHREAPRAPRWPRTRTRPRSTTCRARARSQVRTAYRCPRTLPGCAGVRPTDPAQRHPHPPRTPWTHPRWPHPLSRPPTRLAAPGRGERRPGDLSSRALSEKAAMPARLRPLRTRGPGWRTAHA